MPVVKASSMKFNESNLGWHLTVGAAKAFLQRVPVKVRFRHRTLYEQRNCFSER